MYTASRQGINAYARVGLETGVIAASPHRLILMLFEGAHVALSSALVAYEKRRNRSQRRIPFQGDRHYQFRLAGQPRC